MTAPFVQLYLEKEFAKELEKAQTEDPHFGRIYRLLVRQRSIPDMEGVPVTLDLFHLKPYEGTLLLFFLEKGKQERLYVPSAMVEQFLKEYHDSHGHTGIHRTFERMRGLYIPRFSKVLREYINSCPVCSTSKSKRAPKIPLFSITNPNVPFAAVNIDFITGLPRTKAGNNALMVVVERFSRSVRLVAGKEGDSAEVWADRYFEQVYRSWGLPSVVISDRDAKFTGAFWQALFRRVHTRLIMTSAYHPSADGLVERTNAVVEAYLRCWIASDPELYDHQWDQFLILVEVDINTSKSSATGKTPSEALTGYNLRTDALGMTSTPDDPRSAVEMAELRERVHQDVTDALALTSASMVARFVDKNGESFDRWQEFKPGRRAYLKLAKGIEKGYRIPGMTKLSSRKVGPFPILERVGKGNACKLDLPPEYQIHPVISIVHLELCEDDPYNRTEPPIPEEVGGVERFQVDRVLEKHKKWNKPGYLIKWSGYDKPTWISAEVAETDIPEAIADFEHSLFQGRRSGRNLQKKVNY